jgi:two-component system, LytTR family, response regulator
MMSDKVKSSPSLARVVIVEDKVHIRNDTRQFIERQQGFVVVGSCGTIKEALVLLSTTDPDLVLLDISLADGNAFDLLEQAPERQFKIIFLTAHEEYALKAIKFGALDYLLKPIDESELLVALQKARPATSEQIHFATQQLRPGAPYNRIVLKSQQYIQIVDLADIVYCHSDSGYTTFFLADGRKVVVSKYIKEFIEILPASMFLRPHQSYLVNQKYIDRFHKDEDYLLLKTGVQVPVAARRKEAITQYFNHLH